MNLKSDPACTVKLIIGVWSGQYEWHDGEILLTNRASRFGEGFGLRLALILRTRLGHDGGRVERLLQGYADAASTAPHFNVLDVGRRTSDCRRGVGFLTVRDYS